MAHRPVRRTSAVPGASDDESLSDRVTVVTGASQGIGRATMRRLVEAGATVVAIARDRDRLLASLPQPAESGPDVLALAADVGAEDEIEDAVRTAVDRFGRIDCVVHCAGASMSGRTPLEATTTAEWRRVADTNIEGSYFLTRAVLPLLRQSRGMLIPILSTAASAAHAGFSIYAATKHADRALYESAQEECRESGVRISCISPGPVDTAIWTHKVSPPSADDRRRMLSADDVAETVTWLMTLPRHVHVPALTMVPMGERP
jgi:NADP-dependent 3-hydroxy acid dehydrogenase YdfG